MGPIVGDRWPVFRPPALRQPLKPLASKTKPAQSAFHLTGPEGFVSLGGAIEPPAENLRRNKHANSTRDLRTGRIDSPE